MVGETAGRGAQAVEAVEGGGDADAAAYVCAETEGCYNSSTLAHPNPEELSRGETR